MAAADRMILANMRDITTKSAFGPRRFWIRLRNRFLPWFLWSY